MLDNENENQELDLEQILSEFHDQEQDAPEVEPDEELEQLLHMPQLEITPVTVPEPADLTPEPDEELEAEPPVPEEPEGALEGDTVRFAPVTEEQIAQAAAAIKAAIEPVVTDEPTVAVPTGAPAEEPRPVEPAFEVEEEFIPAPIAFTPRSRLRELKKKLVAGPEKRYYELSEVGVGKLQAAIAANILIVLLSAGVAALFMLEMVPESRLRLVIFSQVLAMMLSALLGCQLMMDSVVELFRGRFTVNTLLTLTFAACFVDALMCLAELRVPCCAAFSLEMTMALWARLQSRSTEMAQMDTMRKAVRLHGIVKVPGYYEGRAGFVRTEGQVEDFMDNYGKVSGPQKVQDLYALVSLACCLGIAALAGLSHGLSLGVQILSTSLLAAVPASFFVSLTRPLAILEQRLHMVGSVLCGWRGVNGLNGKAYFPLDDQDLFPQGCTKLNGVKFYGDRDPDLVVSYTSAVIAAAGGGLVPVFRQLLASRGGLEHRAENFQNYGGGGIGAEVCGEPVLVGSLNFLQDMGVEIPEGTMVNQAVYAAVDGQLSAVYAISYAKMRSAAAGLVTLCGYRKLTPIMLCHDFMLTEDFIRAKFEVKTSRMAFPSQVIRGQLLRQAPDPELPVLALTTREELVSAAYAVTGARALRLSARLGVAIHMLGGVLGMLIMLVLAILGSTELLTPTNVLLYQLIWAVPGLLVTEWTRTV